jgi:hypothetical protein
MLVPLSNQFGLAKEIEKTHQRERLELITFSMDLIVVPQEELRK